MIRRMLFRLALPLALVVMLPCVLMAQDAQPELAHLHKFVDRMASLKSMKASVKLQVVNQQNSTTNTYNGTLESRGNAYFFSTMGMEIYSDGTTRWQYIPSVKEVTVTTVDTTSGSPLDNPLSVFAHYRELYKLAYRGAAKEQGKSIHRFHLYPKDLSSPFSQIHVHITQSDLTPSSITYKGKDGINYTVEITEFLPDAPVRESFAFSKKGRGKVKVIDLR